MSPPGDIAFVGDRASLGEEPRDWLSCKRTAKHLSDLQYIRILDYGEHAALAQIRRAAYSIDFARCVVSV